MGTRPNISESHSEISTRVPFCVVAGQQLSPELDDIEKDDDGEPFYPQNHVGRGWGIRNGAMGAVRLFKILVLTIDPPPAPRHPRGLAGRERPECAQRTPSRAP